MSIKHYMSRILHRPFSFLQVLLIWQSSNTEFIPTFHFTMCYCYCCCGQKPKSGTPSPSPLSSLKTRAHLAGKWRGEVSAGGGGHRCSGPAATHGGCPVLGPVPSLGRCWDGSLLPQDQQDRKSVV